MRSQQRNEQAQPSLKAYRVEFIEPLTEYPATENEGGEFQKVPTEPNRFKIQLHVNPQRKNHCYQQWLCIRPLERVDIITIMMVHQTAEIQSLNDVSGSFSKIYGGELQTQFSNSTNLKGTPKPQGRLLYVQIRDDILDQIIEHGLTKAQSKLFSYLLKLNRFGDRPVKVNVSEILLATRLSKSVYHVAIAKFQRMGWFSFTHAEVEINNYCTPIEKSRKQDSQSRKQDSQSRKQDSQSRKQDSQSGKQDSEELKPLPAQVPKTPQTLQTYSDLLHTLSEGMRESFEKFCLKKIQECSFKIGSRTAWLNKHGAEYLEEFKETYSYALANPEVIPPRKLPFDIPDIPYLKLRYGNGWKDAAIHYGLIDPDSPDEEIQNESEPVAPSEEAPKPIADSGNPQEPTPKPIADNDNPQESTPKPIVDRDSSQKLTPATPAIGANHEQFAKGDRVVIAEVGNAHQGKTGKIIAARFGPKDDKYIIALDRKSPSAREVTIKIPKGCTLTYLEAVAVGGVRY